MPVECNFFGPLRDAVGRKTVSRAVPDGGTVGTVIEALVDDYPDLEAALLDDGGDLRDAVNVTKNKQHINHLGGPETPVEDGDVLRFAAAVIGGAAGHRR